MTRTDELNVTIRSDGDYGGRIELDGVDISGACRSATVSLDYANKPSAEVVLGVVGVEVHGIRDVQWVGLEDVPDAVLRAELDARQESP